MFKVDGIFVYETCDKMQVYNAKTINKCQQTVLNWLNYSL
jgi:hypothetical protein